MSTSSINKIQLFLIVSRIGHKNINMRIENNVEDIKELFEKNYIIHDDVKEVIAGLWKNSTYKKARDSSVHGML